MGVREIGVSDSVAGTVAAECNETLLRIPTKKDSVIFVFRETVYDKTRIAYLVSNPWILQLPHPLKEVSLLLKFQSVDHVMKGVRVVESHIALYLYQRIVQSLPNEAFLIHPISAYFSSWSEQIDFIFKPVPKPSLVTFSFKSSHCF